MKTIFRLLALVVLVAGLPLQSVKAKEVPEPTNFLVNDYAGLFSRQQVVALGEKLRAYVGETSTQIVVVTETSLEGDDVFSYVQRLATTWGIGGGANDNGILIYVAEQDRAIRIQTGRGTEGFLPDVTAKRIIDNIMAPAFRQGNYYQGIDRAADAIMDLGRGEYEGDGFSNAGEELPAWVIILAFILLMLLFSWLSQRGRDYYDDDDDDGGYYRGGRYDMDTTRPYRRRRRRGGTIIIGGGGGWGGGSSGGGGGGWGGFGGGGFGGFGGGSFGGGGAGGSW